MDGLVLENQARGGSVGSHVAGVRVFRASGTTSRHSSRSGRGYRVRTPKDLRETDSEIRCITKGPSLWINGFNALLEAVTSEPHCTLRFISFDSRLVLPLVQDLGQLGELAKQDRCSVLDVPAPRFPNVINMYAHAKKRYGVGASHYDRSPLSFGCAQLKQKKNGIK